MKINLDAEESRSSEGSRCAVRPRCNGKGRTHKGHRGRPRWTPTTPTPLSPAAMGIEETVGIAKSPRAARWECLEPVAEEATIPLRVQVERVLHLPPPGRESNPVQALPRCGF